MESEFKNKVGLVTGAGKRTGIGYGIARALASAGANVVITDLSRPLVDNAPIRFGTMEELEAVAQELAGEYGVKTLALPMDVSSTPSVEEAMDRIKDAFGGLDCLFNNAGTSIGAPQAIHLYDEAAWIKTVDVNLHGVFRVSKAAVPLMLGRQAAIVNVASKAGKAPAPLNGAYAASKAGVIMLTKVMAHELGGQGIRVNAICPGLIKTDLQEGNVALKAIVFNTTVEEAEKQMNASVPLGRMGTIDEVANLCLFLASGQSSYMTGQAINIGGGLLTEA